MADHERAPKGLTRRELGRLGAAGVLATLGAPWLVRSARADSDALVTEIAANESLIAAIQYVNESAKDGQNCGNCVLYQAGADGRGRCALFQEGVVPETGWCASWSPRS